MPITQRILISYEEYQRLIKSEKQYKHLLQTQNSGKKEESASDLVGAGAAETSGLVPKTFLPESAQHLPNSGPTAINTNVAPPSFTPIVYYNTVQDNTDRILQAAKRKNTEPPSLPLNDPLGYRDPDLPEGHAPSKPFAATQRDRNLQDFVQPPPAKAAHTVTKESSKNWWYIGPEHFTSSEEEDEDGLSDV